jgi:hypothetical protein
VNLQPRHPEHYEKHARKILEDQSISGQIIKKSVNPLLFKDKICYEVFVTAVMKFLIP